MKVIPFTLALALAAAALAVVGQPIRVTVDAAEVQFSGVQPQMVGARIMVPLRGVFEQMGCYVQWNSVTRTVTADRAGTNVQLRIGENYADVDGRTVHLDTPATAYGGRVMVPIRFISEALGAQVDWSELTQTVAISTAGMAKLGGDRYGDGTWSQDTGRDRSYGNVGTVGMTTISSGTVIPVALSSQLSSDRSQAGDKFSATMMGNGGAGYLGFPQGTIVEGHVDVASAKTKDAPGVLGLTFDRIRLPNGLTYAVQGSLIGLDSKSVDNQNGRLVAKDSKQDDLKFVGIGAGAGALVALVTKGNILTDTVIGGALGYLYTLIQKDPSLSNNVTLKTGTEFGVRLDRNLSLPNSAFRAVSAGTQ